MVTERMTVAIAIKYLLNWKTWLKVRQLTGSTDEQTFCYGASNVPVRCAASFRAERLRRSRSRTCAPSRCSLALTVSLPQILRGSLGYNARDAQIYSAFP